MALSCCKRSSILLNGITPRNYRYFYYVNYFYSFKTKNRLELPVTVEEHEFDINHKACYIYEKEF